MSFRLSVIVPIYGVEKYIERCAISLFEQSLDNIEFIFVNDKTLDRSIEKLEQVLFKYEHLRGNVKIINHNENLGQACARTTGIMAAQGEYIINLDSDDWIDYNLYSEMFNLAKINNADVVCCNIRFIYQSHVEVLRFKRDENDFKDLSALNFDVLYSSLCNKMIKRELFVLNNILPFKGINMWEDLGVMTRVRYFAKNVFFLNKEFCYNYNKLNETSIVSIPKEKNIQQQILCAKYLEEFFSDKKTDLIVVSFIKFMSKSDYLYNPKIQNIEKWQKIYTETHKDIFKYKTLSFNMKFIAWLASNNYIGAAKFLLNTKNKFLTLFHK